MTMRSYALDTPEGVADRRNYLGASDMATVAGFNPHKSPFQLALEKRGIVEPEDFSGSPDGCERCGDSHSKASHAAIYWGTQHEATIRSEHARMCGRKINERHVVFVHPRYDFIRCHVDGQFMGDPRGPGLFEAKTAGYWAGNRGEDWGEDGTDLYPIPYHIQNQTGLLVTRWTWGELVALIGGNDKRKYPFVADLETQDMIVERAVKFWECVQSGNLDSLSRTVDDMKSLYPTSTQIDVEASDEVAAAVAAFVDLDAKAKQFEAAAEAQKAIVMGHMGAADTLLRNGQKIATWRTQTRKAHEVKESTFRKFAPVKAKGQ